MTFRFAHSRRALASLLVVLSTQPVFAADPAALSLADLAGYRAALVARPSRPPPRPVTYRALWDHPEQYQGQVIEVEGRIVRRFRQGAFGTFPPLVEAWAVTAAGEPFCWVYPESKPSPPSPATTARFVGTFLRRIRYQGADVPRLAPLIVGPAAPTAPVIAPASSKPPGAGFSWVEWSLGAAAATVVAMVLAWQHARKPVSRAALDERGPSPAFLSASDENGSCPEQSQDNSQDEAEKSRDIV